MIAQPPIPLPDLWTLGDLERMRLILGGGSVIDWRRLHFQTKEEVDHYLRLCLFEPNDPFDRARLQRILDEAVDYLRTTFRYALPCGDGGPRSRAAGPGATLRSPHPVQLRGSWTDAEHAHLLPPAAARLAVAQAARAAAADGPAGRRTGAGAERVLGRLLQDAELRCRAPGPAARAGGRRGGRPHRLLHGGAAARRSRDRAGQRARGERAPSLQAASAPPGAAPPLARAGGATPPQTRQGALPQGKTRATRPVPARAPSPRCEGK